MFHDTSHFDQIDSHIQTGMFDTEALKIRMRYVQVEKYPTSQLPFRLLRKRDGVVLGSYESADLALDSLVKMSENRFNPIKTKGRRR